MIVPPLQAALLSILLWSAPADPPPLTVPLTIGSPSPKLAAMKYVKGDVVEKLLPGTIYVVEFSGTECAPCLACVPHMNELQEAYGRRVHWRLRRERETGA